MIFVKILEDVFEVWKEFSPFMHRSLLTQEEFLQWAEELKFLSSFSGKEEFYIFLDYLDEIDLLNPIQIEKSGSEFAQQMRSRRGVIILHFGEPSDEKLDKIEKYYHSFQFFQFITFYNYFRTHSYKKSDFYYFFRKKWIENHYNENETKGKKIKRINKDHFNWIKETNKKMYSGFNRNIDKSDKYDKKTKKKMKRKNEQDWKEWNKEKKTFDELIPGLIHEYWLNSELLKIWIKIDSLIYLPEYIVTPNDVHISHTEAGISEYNKAKRKDFLNRFLIWRENEVKKKDKFLTISELETLKKLYTDIYWSYLRHDDTSDGIENWSDLIDLLPDEKIRQLTGFLNISINIVKILRFIARFTWEFFGYNLEPRPKNKERTKPFYCFSEKSEIFDYRKSVLSNYDLFVDTRSLPRRKCSIKKKNY